MRHLLDALEDPFEVFPMQSVASELAAVITRSDERRLERNGWFGVADKYRSVEDDHDAALVHLLLGSSFVLGQAAITQATSIAKRVRELAEIPESIPQGRLALMTTEAPIHEATGLSQIVLIDAVANYFKHHYEWPDDWRGSHRAQATIDVVRKLGLEPNDEYNLPRAVRALGMTETNLRPMSIAIQEWRERLAAHLRSQLTSNGL